MALSIRNIRHAIKSFIPNWLSNRVGKSVGFSILYVIALACDEVVEAMLEGINAPLPGVGDPSADPYIARSRGLIQGLLESPAAFELRAQSWLDFWTNQAGGAEGLVQSIQSYLGNNLVVRLVDRQGNWVTANADGTTTKVIDATWNWDSAATPWNPYLEVKGRADMWLIIYVTDGRWPSYTSLTDPAWLAAWGTKQGFGAGFQIPRNVVDGVNWIVAQYKGSHTWLAAIVWTTDTTLFIPGSLGGVPDGTWFEESKLSGGGKIPARALNTAHGVVRYQIPPFGG